MALPLLQNATGMIGTVENVHEDRVGGRTNRYQEWFLREVLQFGHTTGVTIFEFAQDLTSVIVGFVVIVWRRRQVPYRDGPPVQLPVVQCRTATPNHLFGMTTMRRHWGVAM